MDWSYIVECSMTDEKYWCDIIKSRLSTGDFYNIKFLIKEDRNMNAYEEYLAELVSEMSQIQAIDINAAVEEKVASYRAQITAEETAKKEKAAYEKQIEIDAVKRLISKVQATLEEDESNVEGE